MGGEGEQSRASFQELCATIPGAVDAEVIEQLRHVSEVNIVVHPSGRSMGSVALRETGQPRDMTVEVAGVSTGSGGEMYKVKAITKPNNLWEA